MTTIQDFKPFDLVCDKELECKDEAKLNILVSNFIAQGGRLDIIPKEVGTDIHKLRLTEGAAVFPVCKGGSCRSQTVAHMLDKSFKERILLMPPLAAHHGYDPYNGRTNRDRSSNNDKGDQFFDWAQHGKYLRAGFENASEWDKIHDRQMREEDVRQELPQITAYYNEHYFGPVPNRQRIYIVFEVNVHCVLKRLSEVTPESFKDVRIIVINWKDTITAPEDQSIVRRSVQAYQAFANKLTSVLDFENLERAQ